MTNQAMHSRSRLKLIAWAILGLVALPVCVLGCVSLYVVTQVAREVFLDADGVNEVAEVRQLEASLLDDEACRALAFCLARYSLTPEAYSKNGRSSYAIGGADVYFPDAIYDQVYSPGLREVALRLDEDSAGLSLCGRGYGGCVFYFQVNWDGTFNDQGERIWRVLDDSTPDGNPRMTFSIPGNRGFSAEEVYAFKMAGFQRRVFTEPYDAYLSMIRLALKNEDTERARELCRAIGEAAPEHWTAVLLHALVVARDDGVDAGHAVARRWLGEQTPMVEAFCEAQFFELVDVPERAAEALSRAIQYGDGDDERLDYFGGNYPTAVYLMNAGIPTPAFAFSTSMLPGITDDRFSTAFYRRIARRCKLLQDIAREGQSRVAAGESLDPLLANVEFQPVPIYGDGHSSRFRQETQQIDLAELFGWTP